MSNEISRLYEFGEFRIDLRKGLLLRGGQPVAVPPKAFETLIALVESGGRVIAKDELMARVWGGTFVEENNLTQQISLLRKILQDPACIETVPRRGYRFAAEVHVGPAILPARSGRVAGPHTKYFAIALVAVAAAIIAFLLLRPPHRNLPRSLAVLPFKPLVGGSGDEYLQLGMADTLISDLSNIRGIRVRPTSSVLPYATATDAAAVGRKLGVEAVLDGRIQRIGDRVRVTAQLVRVDDGASLWAGKFDEDLKNILAVQDAISARIISALTLDLTGDEKRILRRDATKSAEAYELYLRGRYHWYQWTPAGWAKAREYFEQAVAKDPEFALAWVGMADALGVQVWTRPPAEVVPRAKAAAAHALALDPSLADAHMSIGPLLMFYDRDRAQAARELQTGLRLNPNHPLGHDLYALLLASEGRFPQAIAESRRARDLDPTSPYMNTDLGQIYYYQRDYGSAMKQLRVALAIDPDYADAWRYVAAIEEQQKHDAAAIDAWAKFIALNGDPEIAAAVRAAFASGGYPSALRVWLDELTKKSTRAYVSPFELAEINLRLGNRDEAFAWLRKAGQERSPWLLWIGVEPRWDAVRGDPRFNAILSPPSGSAP